MQVLQDLFHVLLHVLFYVIAPLLLQIFMASSYGRREAKLKKNGYRGARVVTERRSCSRLYSVISDTAFHRFHTAYFISCC